MGNGDGAADDQGHVQSVNDLFAVPAFFAAANQVIGDAVVAAENGGGHQAQELFRFRAEGSGLISLVIESKKALHAEVAAVENLFVQVAAKSLKIFEAIRHDSSESGMIIMD